MKKITFVVLAMVALFSGCKKEDPTASTVRQVSVPLIVNLMEDQYLGAVGGAFDAQIERIDGVVGYAVDTVFGFDVDGVTVDTIWFTDPEWAGDTLIPGTVSLKLVAVNKGGYAGSASSTFLVLDPPSDPYETDISGEYYRNGVAVSTVTQVVPGVYLLDNPIFSTNLAWKNLVSIMYHSQSGGLDITDTDGTQTAAGNFGTWEFSNESYDDATLTICADGYRLEDALALSRCGTKQ
ncbi:MAG: hypothetical protein K1X55_01235 [Chitinophagales bacterium]|nr:hypothetical protein [Chitinophagales bacterium]